MQENIEQYVPVLGSDECIKTCTTSYTKHVRSYLYVGTLVEITQVEQVTQDTYRGQSLAYEHPLHLHVLSCYCHSTSTSRQVLS